MKKFWIARMMMVAAAVLMAGAPALAKPDCGGVASLMNRQVFVQGPNAGSNIVSIPLVSPINNTPGNGTNNGFHQLCARFGLSGTGTALFQIDADGGSFSDFTCNQTVAPNWTPGQAVIIRPSAGASARIPGVECSDVYSSFPLGTGAAKGRNLFSVPLTYSSSDPQDLCTQLGLAGDGGGPAADDQILRFRAGPGFQTETHTCGAAVSGFTLALGEGVVIQPVGLRSGTAILY